MADHRARRHGYHLLHVKQVIQETDDARSYILEVPIDLRDQFTYRAGQFCTFRVRLGDEELIRCYSMSSAPETDAHITVTVKRVPGGKVSNWFNDVVAEGDALEVMRPGGVFCLRAGDRPIVAFAGGSGITPVISIAKSALSTTERPVHVLYANRDADSVIFADELDRLAGAHPDRLVLRHHHDVERGYLTEQQITDFVDGRQDADVYICGPDPFMDLVEEAVLKAGVATEQISIERFGGTPLPDLDDEEATAGGPGSDTTESVTIVVKRKKTTVDHHQGDTILIAARRGGVQTPFSCEAGTCASCMAMLTDGSVRMRANAALTPEEVDEGWVLTCQSIPTSRTVTVEFD